MNQICYYLALFFFLMGHFVAAQAQTPQFKAQTLDADVAIGYGLAIGDVDGDEKPDILLADKKAFVWYRNPDWQRFVLAENLTERDNVCIAARDIDGDGRVEIAVGGQWNPGETSNPEASGSVHYLIRPEDPTQVWESMQLPHVPTIHRMRWATMGQRAPTLLVLPLHGVDNVKGEGNPVNLLGITIDLESRGDWDYGNISTGQHMTHNFDLVEREDLGVAGLYIAGKEGLKAMLTNAEAFHAQYKGSFPTENWIVKDEGFGEVRLGKGKGSQKLIAGIQPMHGNELNVYYLGDTPVKQNLATDMNQGHALACADLLGMGEDQIVVGWRNPNKVGKVGIRMYVPQTDQSWKMFTIDDNTMACEDLKVADLNGDGKPDIIAAGRASHNLKVYWNFSP